MAKRTINLDKIEDVDSQLLEEGLRLIAEELRRRTNKVYDSICDRKDLVKPVNDYKKRHEILHNIVEKCFELPARISYLE